MGGQAGAATGGRGGTGGAGAVSGSTSTGGRAGASGAGGLGGMVGGAGTVGRDAGPDLKGGGGTPNTGGNAGAGGSGAGGSTICVAPPPNEELIDDLNDGDRFIPSSNGRAGAWSDSHDDSPNAKMFPDPSTNFTPTKTDDACRKYAVYVAGGGYVLWGASFWFGLGSPYDASKYTGISFWAKVDAGASQVIRVSFPDKDTHPDGNLCDPSASSGQTACFDHYGQRLTLSTTWTKHRVTFAGLTQDGWGHKGTSFDPTTIYQTLFQIPVGANFGIWIDDVAFGM